MTEQHSGMQSMGFAKPEQIMSMSFWRDFLRTSAGGTKLSAGGTGGKYGGFISFLDFVVLGGRKLTGRSWGSPK